MTRGVSRVLVIGAGPSAAAVSPCLAAEGIDVVCLEPGDRGVPERLPGELPHVGARGQEPLAG